MNHHRLYYQNKLDWFEMQHQSFEISKVINQKDGRVGRPNKLINEEQVASLRSLGMNWKKIANILGICEDTLRKKRQSFSNDMSYSDLTDPELDRIIQELLISNPCLGERMVQGHLLAKGHKVQRFRMRESIHRVTPSRLNFNKRKIFRRSYNVPCPNALWHVDGHHKLIRWRLVTHGCIDGYSRTITFLHCSANNKAITVFNLFLSAIESFRMPMRIRTDHGTENVLMARYMIEKRGIQSSPVITGKSVHNQRIERLWVDVFLYVAQQYRNIFYMLESDHDMNPSNDLHVYALHYIYIPRVNKSLSEFADGWNHHPLRTEKNRSPLAIWTEGFYNFTGASNGPNLLDMTEADSSLYGIDYNGPTPELQTNNNVQIPEIELNLTQAYEDYIKQNFDPFENDSNYGIEIYKRLVNYLETVC